MYCATKIGIGTDKVNRKRYPLSIRVNSGNTVFNNVAKIVCASNRFFTVLFTVIVVFNLDIIGTIIHFMTIRLVIIGLSAVHTLLLQSLPLSCYFLNEKE